MKSITATNSIEIKFHCPHCTQRISTTLEQAGSKGECPTCSRSLTVPGASSEMTKRRSFVLPVTLATVVTVTAGAWMAVSSARQTQRNHEIAIQAMSEAAARRDADRDLREQQVRDDLRREQQAAAKAAADARRAMEQQMQEAEQARVRRAEEARQEEKRSAAAAIRNAELAKVTRIEGELGTLRQQFREIQGRLEAVDAAMETYKTNHAWAIAKISAAAEGAEMAMDEKRSPGERFGAGLVAFLAGANSLSDENLNESTEVFQRMAAFQTERQKLKANLARIEQRIAEVTTELNSAQKLASR